MLQEPSAWDTVEASYDNIFAPVLVAYSRTAVELAGPDANACVLDVAAGPGTLALLVAPAVRRVAALDFSPGMIERLRAVARARSLANVEAVVGNGQALPYADAEFDAAFSMFGLIFFADRALGLRELRRVLRPGGRAVVASWAPIEPTAPPMVLAECLREALGRPPGPPLEIPLASPVTMRGALLDAGFEEVEVSYDTHEFVAADVEAFWSAQSRANVLVTGLMRGMSTDDRGHFEARVLDALRERLGTGEVRYPQTALLGLGVRGRG
ncbi:MAG: methyltransferase domain-containing protein [Nannocystaceae bacterium]